MFPKMFRVFILHVTTPETFAKCLNMLENISANVTRTCKMKHETFPKHSCKRFTSHVNTAHAKIEISQHL